MRLKLGQVIEQLFYYAVLFFILREWLKPIIELTSMSYLNVFMAFVAVCFVLNILQVNFVISAIVKLLFMAAATTQIFSGYKIVSTDGLSFLIDDIRVNVGALLGFDFAALTNPFRTMLFFVLLWMLSYLMHYWLTVRMSIFYFLVLTIFFIATLNTFTEYDGTTGIVMVLILGLIMSAGLYLKRMLMQTGEELDGRRYVMFILPVGLLVLAIGFTASVLPKAEPQWADPVPYFKQLTGNGSGSSVSKVGIGEDDTALGGAFVGDDTVVYEIEASHPQYWRVETKDIYTSKGWEASDDGTSDVTYAYPAEMPVGPVDNDSMAKVTSNIDATYILQNYGMHGLQLPVDDAKTIYDIGKGRLDSYIGDEKIALENYEIAYSSPKYSYTALKNSVQSSVINGEYLQLPETLPKRVYDLAMEITEPYTNQYDRAKAIERYFKTSGFIYETTNVAIPEEGQDYVDQFLFETKRGYCDNFSTSMVVLLRAIGIEARWVKGYAEGNEVRKLENGNYLYEIENNHAHSWVEAYINGVGWMMFEPTIGFSNQIDIDFDMELDVDAPEEEVKAQQQEQQKQKLEKEQDQVQREEINKAASKELPNWVWFVVAAVIILLGALMLWKRQKWMPKVEIMRQRISPSDVETAYERLLKHLARSGIRKRKDETIREFAIRVDRHTGTDDMTKITEVYEKAIYSKDANISFDEIKENWENLINNSSG